MQSVSFLLLSLILSPFTKKNKGKQKAFIFLLLQIWTTAKPVVESIGIELIVSSKLIKISLAPLPKLKFRI